MQVFVKRRIAFQDPQQNSKKTLVSIFVSLLIKLCILPITVKDNKLKLSFIKFPIHLLLVVTPSLLYYFYMINDKYFVDFISQSDLVNQARYVEHI